ncbi:response regulator transcription factor, partial [Agrobacterium tumefaciens]|uniref:response regulator transcription factor n=1 Tax=Agrobacterium tumefaciens TaxID=358 RepID=UPI001BAC9CB6
APAENTQGKVQTWVNSRWKYPGLPGQFSVEINNHAVLRLQGGLAPEYAPLSPRERECLLWIGEGKTYWECARILGLSEHTVRFYLESARHKLGAANTTHAISKAVKASLLSRLP